jgi:vancomycin resistance protein YoaR
VGVDVNYEDISEKLKSGLKVFEVETEVIPPEITAEKLEQSLFADVLGEFTTNYNSSNTGRTKNMAIAAGKINGTVIAPGEIFSFNTVVGERSYQRGYTDANVYIGGRIEQGVGGGICQVASTMYSAQLYAIANGYKA